MRGGIISLLLVASWAIACSGQSLGDVARQEKAKKATAPAAKHVYTDDDLKSTANPATQPKQPEKDKATEAPQRAASSGPKDALGTSAEEMKARIKEQKQNVAESEDYQKKLQAKLDKWKGSDCTHVYLAERPSENACGELEKLKTAVADAGEQTKKERALLESMQEEARKRGFRSVVYDPD